MLKRFLCDVPGSHSQRCRRLFAEEMPEIGVSLRKAKRMPELKLLLETLKSHIPDAKIVECSLRPIDRIQLLPKRCWCHVIKHHASFIRHRLESWSTDKS